MSNSDIENRSGSIQCKYQLPTISRITNAYNRRGYWQHGKIGRWKMSI
ncbi:MAG: hypothetical protein IPL13_19420 [Saprospiraceae bacterium]|nr:hypothetical protein [Candidatus Brachybacter algidus]